MPPHVETAAKGDRHGNDSRCAPRALPVVERQSRLAQAEQINGVLAAALCRLGRGLFIVTASSAVLFANAVAEGLLGNGLHLNQRHLAAEDRAQTDALRQLIFSAARDKTSGGVIITQKQAAGLLLTVIPVSPDAWSGAGSEPAAMIVTKDLNPISRRLDAFSLYYGLTPAETRVARELLVGDGIAGVAQRLSISEATARTHRIRVFQKIGVGRQAQLVRRILEWTEDAVNGA